MKQILGETKIPDEILEAAVKGNNYIFDVWIDVIICMIRWMKFDENRRFNIFPVQFHN